MHVFFECVYACMRTVSLICSSSISALKYVCIQDFYIKY